MLKQTRKSELQSMINASKEAKPGKPEDVSLTTLIPAFILSELKTAFLIGFVIFVPFLVIDLVVSSSLMSMGMMMLPPSLVSLPFKLLLFVMVDGWALVVSSLLSSFK
jgi:flagellar biosynthetic protein FliP